MRSFNCAQAKPQQAPRTEPFQANTLVPLPNPFHHTFNHHTEHLTLTALGSSHLSCIPHPLHVFIRTHNRRSICLTLTRALSNRRKQRPAPKADDDAQKVFAGNLAFATTEDELKSLFSEAGKVVSTLSLFLQHPSTPLTDIVSYSFRLTAHTLKSSLAALVLSAMASSPSPPRRKQRLLFSSLTSAKSVVAKLV